MDDRLANLLITLAGSLPTLLAVILSNRAHDKVVDEQNKFTNERISELARNVEKHNNLVERMVIVEQSTKSAHHRLDDITAQLKITERRK